MLALSVLEWKMYPNFCVSATNVDLPQTNRPSRDANINTCKSGCIHNSKCSAIEWYSSGWGGSKCKLMLSDVPASKGSPAGRWQDAECYVKPDTGKVYHRNVIRTRLQLLLLLLFYFTVL